MVDIEVWVAEADLSDDEARLVAGKLRDYARDLVHEVDPNREQPTMFIDSNVAGICA